jgi:hypothetical protein
MVKRTLFLASLLALSLASSTHAGALPLLAQKELRVSWTTVLEPAVFDGMIELVTASDRARYIQAREHNKAVVALLRGNDAQCTLSYHFKDRLAAEPDALYATHSFDQAHHEIAAWCNDAIDFVRVFAGMHPAATAGKPALSGVCRYLKARLLEKLDTLTPAGALLLLGTHLESAYHLEREADAHDGELIDTIDTIMLGAIIQYLGIADPRL